MAASEPSAGPPTTAIGPAGDPSIVVFVVEARLDHASARALTDRLLVLTDGGIGRVVVCDVGVILDPDLATVDALARLALDARRAGCRIRLRQACPDLRNLLALAGLAEILPCVPASVVEVSGQAEERKEVRRIQEERDPTDPIAGELEHL